MSNTQEAKKLGRIAKFDIYDMATAEGISSDLSKYATYMLNFGAALSVVTSADFDIVNAIARLWNSFNYAVLGESLFRRSLGQFKEIWSYHENLREQFLNELPNILESPPGATFAFLPVTERDINDYAEAALGRSVSGAAMAGGLSEAHPSTGSG